MGSKSLFDQLNELSSEQRNARSSTIDSLDVTGILKIINHEDSKVPDAVSREIPAITKAVKLIIHSFRQGGRLLYVGAGTSGRLGILDAAECPPTFGTKQEMVQGIIAGGSKALFRSQEGAEDKSDDGAMQIRRMRVSEKDVVCGIAASIRTPFAVGAIQEAKKRGAHTIYLTTNPRSLFRRNAFAQLRRNIDVAICVDVGAEVIMGSTRMKAGTAQKIVLNMLTTTSMIQLGKVYMNMMVDLKMTSRKLEERAKRILMIATGVDYTMASRVLREARGHVKTAIVMIKADVSAEVARMTLEKTSGRIRPAIAYKKRSR